ncbi:MAG TPA: helix-turn-helix transcriptional regulator [Gemmatimonadaceae bacterium]|nr:helix-turn-helix transcriptional regulator [Gemmatimonadaceae bacterium]
MPATESRSPPPPAPATHVGALLRDWRAGRRLSQLDLALAADVSSRHLSYVETGRAQPSRELVSRLAEALDIPLRERNTLLIAAGYAPDYRETALSAPEMAQARHAVELILNQQEPYPAIVMNRHWDLLMANRSTTRMFRWLLGGPAAEPNIMRGFFDPNGVRPWVVNWEEVAGDLVKHLHDDVAAAPSDTRARTLLRDVLSYPNIPSRWRTRELGAPASPLSTITYAKDDVRLTFFWTITTFGTPRDVTLEELRIECSFPADDATDQFCRSLT